MPTPTDDRRDLPTVMVEFAAHIPELLDERGLTVNQGRRIA